MAEEALSGLHLIADLHACPMPNSLMHEVGALAAYCRACVLESGLQAVGEAFHGFGTGCGVTGVIILAESHVCVHTWPELGRVTLDVYVCNFRGDNRAKAEHLLALLVRGFNPQATHCQRVERD